MRTAAAATVGAARAGSAGERDKPGGRVSGRGWQPRLPTGAEAAAPRAFYPHPALGLLPDTALLFWVSGLLLLGFFVCFSIRVGKRTVLKARSLLCRQQALRSASLTALTEKLVGLFFFLPLKIT